MRDVWRAIESLQTLSIGQEEDLKVDLDGLRLWLSRMCEGELAVEVWLDGEWREVWRGELLSGEGPDRLAPLTGPTA
ncbi:MAG: hypothetical protein GY719_02370 [bacterium]|nr:hypothetical protein [bacterium]